MDRQLWSAAGALMLTVVTVYFLQRRDIDKLEAGLNRRIDDLRSEMAGRFAALHDLLKSEVRRLDEKLDRLERPVLKG